MGCLAASQPRIYSLTLLKARAPCFPQLGVKLSSLCTRLQLDLELLQKQFKGAESFSIRLTAGLRELEAEHRPPESHSQRQPLEFSAARKIVRKKEKVKNSNTKSASILNAELIHKDFAWIICHCQLTV